MAKPSQKHTANARAKVWDANGRVCHYCQKELPRPGTKRGYNCHFDHVIPMSKGGSDEMENLVPSCKRCNMDKGDMDYDEFIQSKIDFTVNQLKRLRKLLKDYKDNDYVRKN